MKTLIVLLLLIATTSQASSFPKADADLKSMKQHFAEEKETFAKSHPANPESKEWVKAKLQFMFDIDQEARKFEPPGLQSYTKEEKKYFEAEYQKILDDIDSKNLNDLMDLLKLYQWFKISEFGKDADFHAWLLVQHSDTDLAFQRKILAVLEKLYPINETGRKNYAYLFDRVAVAVAFPKERVLQRYGTQGECKGPGTWEPYPMEEPNKVDERRLSMGLNTLAEYKKMFTGICR